MFLVAEAYEASMGRWSRQLAPFFVEFAGVVDGEMILDVGCGTGALSATLARVTNPRVTFDFGDAQALPYADGVFDRCMALLIVNFVPDAPKAAKEMRRVTKSGGVMATTMWDGSGANRLNACFWDAAEAMDPAVKRPIEKPGSYASAARLLELWNGAGLMEVVVAELTMPCQFSSFDELWQRYTGGSGSGPSSAYVAGVGREHREQLRQRLRQDVLRGRTDGAITLQAKAWAVKGRVP